MQFVQRLEPGHPASVLSLAVHGRSVWVGLSDGSVYVWRSDNKSRQRLRGIGAEADGVASGSLRFEPVRALCAVGRSMWIGAGELSVWDANDRSLEVKLDKETHDGAAITLLQFVPRASIDSAASGDGGHVVSGASRSSSLVVWDSATREPMQRVSVSGERGPRHVCLLGSLVVVDAGRFVVVCHLRRANCARARDSQLCAGV